MKHLPTEYLGENTYAAAGISGLELYHDSGEAVDTQEAYINLRTDVLRKLISYAVRAGGMEILPDEVRSRIGPY